MQFLELKDFRRTLNELWKHGGRHQKAAETVTSVLGKIGTLDDPFHGLRVTKHGESRIPNCIKYDLNDFCRLVTVQTNGFCVFLTCGSHADVDRWLDAHAGFVPVVGPNGRVVPTYCSSEEIEGQLVRGEAGHYDGPLRERLPEEWMDALLDGLPRRVARQLEDIEATITDSELKALVAPIEVERQRLAVYDVFALLRQDRVAESVARVKLFMGDVAPLEAPELPEIVDSDVIRRIAPTSPRYHEALTRFMKTAGYRDWMLFMHPSQELIANEDFDGPAKLIGVSGSGKTCVVVQRAIRLAGTYENGRVLVLTLNRALAALIGDLIAACVPEELAARIEVKPFFALCQELLATFEPDVERHFSEVTWKLGEHVDEIWHEFYRCENNNRDARVFEDVHDSLLARGWGAERYIRQEVDWLRSAVEPSERQRYLTLPRKGRTVQFLPHYKQQILQGTAAWEEKMAVVGVVDALGIAQHLTRHLWRIRPRYRCVLVDEMQDFGNVELQIVRALVQPSPNDVFLCGDAAQAVSFKHQSLREIGIDTAHRSRQLTLNYRNSRDVLTAAFEVLWQNLGDEMFDREDLDILDPEYSAFTGATPLILRSESLEEELGYAFAACRERVADHPGRKACIAVCGFSLFEISRFGASLGVPVLDGSRSINDDSVFLSDLEQTKGFEFDLVCVVNTCVGVIPQPAAPTEERFRDLSRLYVAMTRAKTDLILSYHGAASEFLGPAMHGFYASDWSEYVEVTDHATIAVPLHTEELRVGKPQKRWREMTGAEFLLTDEAIGTSTELSAKLRQLVDGRPLTRKKSGRREEQLKWRNLGGAADAYVRDARVRVLWGPEVGRQFKALCDRLAGMTTPSTETPSGEMGGPTTHTTSPKTPGEAHALEEDALVPSAADARAEHRRLLQSGFAPQCNRGAFTVEQWKQLRRFGSWYQALCERTIEPLTDEQRSFVALFAAQEERAPQTNHERLWAAYLERVARERTLAPPRAVATLKGASRTSSATPSGDDDAVYFSHR